MVRPPRVSKNGKNSINGKEESYERNPGRVPFVFNQKFSELLKVLKTCSGWRKYFFASLRGRTDGPPSESPDAYRVFASSTTFLMAAAASSGSLLKPPSSLSSLVT